MWCIERLNSLNTLTEHNESTSTWFGLTEQHDRGHVTANKFPGRHIPPRQVSKQYVASRLELIKCSSGQEGSISNNAIIKRASFLDDSSRDPLRPPGVVSDTHGITKLHSARSAMLIMLFRLSRLSQMHPCRYIRSQQIEVRPKTTSPP